MVMEEKCKSTFSEVEKIGKKIRETFRNKLNDQIAFELELIFNEICTNIIRHGYKYLQTGLIEVKVKDLEKDHALIIVKDSAPKFNPELYNKKLGEIEDLENGGMGIYIIKKIATDLIYKYENNQNIYEIII